MSRAAPLVGLAALLSLIIGACSDPSPAPVDPYRHDELATLVLEEETAPTEAPAAIAETGDGPLAREPVELAAPEIVPAAAGDREYAGTELVIARRYVYRVRMIVVSALGTNRSPVGVPAAELVLDVSHERLRARFMGPGWPVPPGSEVRIRRDRPGVYVFDGNGGRPLAPGELASWFEGGEITRRGPMLRVFAMYGFHARMQLPDDREDPGELVCALLAELGAEERESVMRRCRRGAPHLWRLGFWRGEQTAAVPLELRRESLRADELGPPRAAPQVDGGAFLEQEALGRIEPEPRRGPALRAPIDDRRGLTLTIRNRSATRAVITMAGIPLGWIDSGTEESFVGFRAGSYEIGTIRPLGAILQRARSVTIPSDVHSICDGNCRWSTPIDADQVPQ